MSCHHRKADEKALFNEEFTVWFNSARQFISAELTHVFTPGVVSPEVPRRTSPEFPREVPRETSPYIPSKTSPQFPREVPRETPQYVPCRTPHAVFRGVHQANDYPSEELVLQPMVIAFMFRVDQGRVNRQRHVLQLLS